MWHGKMKAVTFSYDDGVGQDIRLIEMFDRYGLRGTFNLNLGLQKESNTFVKSGIVVRHLNAEDLPKVYARHEVAGHTYTHAHLERLEEGAIREEITRCQDGLAQLFGREVLGMAYPYGTYDERVIRVAQEAGVRYSRTCVETEGFEAPADLLRLPATCRHANPRLLELARRFVETDPQTPQLFYLWGHSYEFDERDNWGLMEECCKILAGHEDIYYGTNSQTLLGISQVCQET